MNKNGILLWINQWGFRPHVAIKQVLENIAYCHTQLEDNEAEKYHVETKEVVKGLNELREGLDKEINFILTDILKNNDNTMNTNNKPTSVANTTCS